MATIVLQAAGAYLGGLLGSTAAVIGTAAGALAGYAIDRALLSGTERIEGPRLAGQKPFTAEEGASLPRVYGSVRVGGTMIWATRFEEDKKTRRQGRKGPKVTEYSYYANAAFALCEGPIAGVRRIWADGKEIDREEVELRIWNGDETQGADPFIAVKQGTGNTPAYRGTAYVVVERLPIGQFGNRLPQLQFEVLRPVGLLHRKLRAVTLIPGATEYGLSPDIVTREERKGDTDAVNRHMLHAETDIAASLDELQMLCPELEDVALVVSWFGNDLRADHCTIKPGVTDRLRGGFSKSWSVAGLSRGEAHQISHYAGGAAYGGTPSDTSVKAAIAEIRSRGLKVTLYPFLMMDVPAGNGLPDPYGADEQGSYPWRGRITVDPAPGLPGTPDKTAGARTAVDLFSGGPNGWGYRRLVRHYASLAKAAGGVDAFLLGSELRGLSTLRDETGTFPFVESLCDLAEEVRAILGANTAITYGADWSEYFGYHPTDGSGDIFFHLDPLWAHPAIDAVGVDNYLPLSDWRDGDHAGGHPDGAHGPSDGEAMRAGIASGEGFDWYYPDMAARNARERSPITDGACNKPWVFRPKDLVNWWSQPHFDRPGGVEAAIATAWVPCSKPIWFTELGCPAVDKGANQPNVFPDPKSTESASPYFSNGGRCDLVQRRFLDAHLGWWDPADPRFEASANPVSPINGRRMLDVSRIYAWAWDARPFPAFPLRQDYWSDGTNWQTGHWLTGRMEAPGVGDLIGAILADHGLPSARTEAVEGSVQGYLLEPGSAREALEPLVDVFGLGVNEDAEGLVFQSDGGAPAFAIEPSEIVAKPDEPAIELRREPDHDLPAEAYLSFRNLLTDYQAFSSRAVRLGAKSRRVQTVSLPAVLDPGAGDALIEDWLRRRWNEREEIRLALPPQNRVEPGMLLTIEGICSGAPFRVTSVDRGLVTELTARRRSRDVPAPWRMTAVGSVSPVAPIAGRPHLLLLDLPLSGADTSAENQFRIALWQKPWRPQLVYASPETSGYALRRRVETAADIGRLTAPLLPGVSGRFSRRQAVTLELPGGEAASVSRAQLLNGANALAVRSAADVWEVLQFEAADEIAPDVFRLSSLLRGQLGTEDAMASGAPTGADAVILDDAVLPAGLRPTEIGLLLNWRAGPSGTAVSDRFFATEAKAGGVRAQTPLSPVHLRARRSGSGGILFSWIRRGRIDADGWEAEDTPIGEDREEYQLEIAGETGAPVRSVVVDESAWTYGPTERSSDFPASPAVISLTVRQHGTSVGWGVPARKLFPATQFFL